MSDAWRFAEDACYRHGLVPDVSPKAYCSTRFLERSLKGAVAISCEIPNPARGPGVREFS